MRKKKRKRVRIRLGESAPRAKRIKKVRAIVPAELKEGQTPNPGGRPTGSINKTMPDYRRMKQGLVELFNNSQAPAILNQMLNMRLPPMLRPQNRDKLTAQEDAHFRSLLLKNFQWAVEMVVKCVPKELGVFGKLEHELTLAGLSKRATQAGKSAKVIDMVEKRREKETKQFQMQDPLMDVEKGEGAAEVPEGAVD